MIQPKARKMWMSFNFSLDPFTTESELKSPQRKLQLFNITYKKVIFAGVYGYLQKYSLVILEKWQALLKVTGLHLDFVKLGFVGSVSFIC